MKLANGIEKLTDYYERFEKGKVAKIKPKHVDRVLKKLRSKEEAVREKLKDAKKQENRKRLTRKLSIITTQIDRGEWLQTQIKKLKKSQ